MEWMDGMAGSDDSGRLQKLMPGSFARALCQSAVWFVDRIETKVFSLY